MKRESKGRFSYRIQLVFIGLVLCGIVSALTLATEDSSANSPSSNIVKASPLMLAPTVLHFQGNAPEEAGCTGDGMADFTACTPAPGGPFLNTNATLSTSSAAHWDPPVGVVTNVDRAANHTDPNWIWNLTGPTRLVGQMTIEWWAACGACGPSGNADWVIRLWADGTKVFEERITATPDLPNVPKLLTTTVDLAEINATSKIVLHIDPVFIDSQQNTHIYYDSQSPCPGSLGSAPCDSKVTMPVLGLGDPTPTPTPTPTPPPASSCALPTFDNYQPPVGYPRRDSSGEPSIGINWNSGNVMTMSRLHPNRTTFDDSTSPADPLTTTWFSASSPAIVTGLDPILWTDPVTGRTIAGELQGALGATNGVISDDDLSTIVATFQTGVTNGADHQTIGGGPPNPSIANRQPSGSYPHLFYYASQSVATATVATSFDGGVTYQPAVPAYTLIQCGGLHGHVKVAPDGTVYIPNKGCSGRTAIVASEDNGLNWNLRAIPSSTSGRTDPSIGIGSGGKLYVAYAGSDNHPRVAVSDDKGLTWPIDLDLAQSVSPGITAAVFPHAVAGDNNRAAVFFLGTTSTDPLDPTGTDNGGAGPNFAGTWFPYIATTCDGGVSWSVVRADNDPLNPGMPNPVQQGVVCTNGTTCPAGPPNTRNLLDFNDLTVDSRGRIVAVYADGCNFDHPCINITDNSGTRVQNQGLARLTIIRQRGGMRLFAAFDPGGPVPPPLPPPVQVEQTNRGYSLKWPTPDDNNSPLTSYRIYRGTRGEPEHLVATVSAKQNRFVDRKSFKHGRAGVYYKVAAVNAYGEGPRKRKFFPHKL